MAMIVSLPHWGAGQSLEAIAFSQARNAAHVGSRSTFLRDGTGDSQALGVTI